MFKTLRNTKTPTEVTDPSMEGIVEWYKKKVSEAATRGEKYKTQKDTEELDKIKKEALVKLEASYSASEKRAHDAMQAGLEAIKTTNERFDDIQKYIEKKSFSKTKFNALRAPENFMQCKTLDVGVFDGNDLVDATKKIISEYLETGNNVRDGAVDILIINYAYELDGEEDSFTPTAKHMNDPEESEERWLKAGSLLIGGGYKSNFVTEVLSKRENITVVYKNLISLCSKLHELYEKAQTEINNYTVAQHTSYKEKYKKDNYKPTHPTYWEVEDGFQAGADYITSAIYNYRYYCSFLIHSIYFVSHSCYE